MTDQLTSETADFTTDDRAPSNGVRPARSVDDRLDGGHPRWPALLAGLAIGAAGTVAIGAWIDRGDDESADETIVEVTELDTVAVETRDLVEEVDWSGTVASGATTTIAAPVAGTVTATVAEGEVVARGDEVVRIDDRPIVALVGSIPMWRDLDVGVEGDDVLQLETNLSALGFDPDGDVTIDTEYTWATADMVEAWQESLGVDTTGDVRTGDVVVVPGDSTVVSAPTVGSPAQIGADLVTIETPAVALDVVGAADVLVDDAAGVVDSIAAPGTVVEHGTVLATVDGVDVVAVSDVSDETRAVLDAFATDDVEEIESVLAYIGYDPSDEMDVDDDVDEFTTAAIVRWQESVGLPATGSASSHGYVVVPSDRTYTVGQPAVEVGTELGDGRLVTQLVSPTLSVTADVAVTEIDEFSVGQQVTVEQVDESTFVAVVASIDDTTTESTDGGDPTVLVSFDVTEAPEEYLSGTVTITTESSRIDGAIVVPTRALVTLREGGFAVERSNADGSTELVAVELGTFDDGVVEVVSGDLAPGDLVVVPS